MTRDDWKSEERRRDDPLGEVGVCGGPDENEDAEEVGDGGVA